MPDPAAGVTRMSADDDDVTQVPNITHITIIIITVEISQLVAGFLSCQGMRHVP